jgi:hypothetical protein
MSFTFKTKRSRVDHTLRESSSATDAYIKIDVEHEVSSYVRTIGQIEGDDEMDPLVWWRGMKDRFPRVARAARKWLSVTATSTPSERVFSICGSKYSCTTTSGGQKRLRESRRKTKKWLEKEIRKICKLTLMVKNPDSLSDSCG